MLISAIMDNGDFETAERETHQLLVDIHKVIGLKERKYSVSASRPSLFLPRAYMLRGMTLLHLERTEDALHALQMALTYNPDDHISQHLVSVALMGLERYPEALVAAQRTIELQPKSSASRTLMGMILIKSGREREAITFLEQSVAMNSHDTIAKLELAWLLATDPSPKFRDGERALTLSREVTQMIGGGNYRTLDAMAAAYAASGNFEDAIKTANKAFMDLKRQIENGTAEATSRGVVHSNLKNIKERLDNYKDGSIWCRPTS
jgi:tetratricopeptide (TPR) repeat protein